MLDFSKLKTYPLSKRKNKVSIQDFSQPADSLPSGFPDIFAGRDFKDFVQRILTAHQQKKQVVFMMGAHVIKCGVNNLINDLITRGVLTHITLNGAGPIHDFELAYQGATSEDVGSSLEDGSFGFAEETGRIINETVQAGAAKDIGFGEAMGKHIAESDYPHKDVSILATAYKNKVPVTVHTAIGTEIIHQHPACDGAALGKASYQDFKIFANTVSKLEGGVLANFGSSVILPEVFLKTLTIARNLGHKVENFTTADFDMIYHYRPRVNVVERPTSKGGKGFSFTGRHELMIPLLYHALVKEL